VPRHEDVKGNGSKAPSIINYRTRLRLSASQSAQFIPEKKNMRLGGHQNRFGQNDGAEKKSLPLPRTESLSSSP